MVRKARNSRTKGKGICSGAVRTTTAYVLGLGSVLFIECERLGTGMRIFAFAGVPHLKKIHFRLTMVTVVHAAAEFPTRVHSADLEYGRHVSGGVPGTLTPKILG